MLKLLPRSLSARVAACALIAFSASALPIFESAAIAQSASPSPQMQQRADGLLQFLSGKTRDLHTLFSDRFLREVGEQNARGTAKGLAKEYGSVQKITAIFPENSSIALIEIEYETSIIAFKLVIDPAAPHKVEGLFIQGIRAKNDNFALIRSDFEVLPGASGFAVAELTPQGPKSLVSYNADKPFGVASGFKLYVLSELTAQVQSGRQSWDNVAQLSHKSVGDGLNKWPDNAPLTLYSLAAEMISISDNSATDTLMYLLGRNNVEGRVLAIGHSQPELLLPFLTTREMLALKMSENKPLRDEYYALDEAGQDAFVRARAGEMAALPVNEAELASNPLFIDKIEWFASPNDMVAVLDYLRKQGDPSMFAILAINPGIGRNDAARWGYLGYKGGSESGVIHMSFLTRHTDGRWFAITGSWNDPKAPVDESKFTLLMTRLLNQTVK